MFQEEQRSNRSQAPDLAIHYQLKQLKSDFGVVAILVDDSAKLVSASDSDDMDLYYALATDVHRLADGDNCRLLFAKLNEIKRIQSNQISTKSFLVKGKRYFIITIGASDLLRDIGSYRAFFGLRRICGEGSLGSSVVSRKPEALTL